MERYEIFKEASHRRSKVLYPSAQHTSSQVVMPDRLQPLFRECLNAFFTEVSITP